MANQKSVSFGGKSFEIESFAFSSKEQNRREKIIEEVFKDIFLKEVLQESETLANSRDHVVDVKKIPHIFHEDELFQKWVCPITKQPIRFPVKVEGIEGCSFERAALEKFLNLRIKPPSWPSDCSFPPDREKIIADGEASKMINERLEFMANEIFTRKKIRYELQ